MALRFLATIEIINVNPYVLVKKDLVHKLKPNWKKPLPVIAQINRKPIWKINMMPIGNGDFYLYLHGGVRKASNTKVGDKVNVTVFFDNDYISGPMPMPVWFEKELNKNTDAKGNWNKLIPSRKKEIIRYLLNLKSDDAKKINLKKTMSVLSGNEEQFMGRPWKNGK